MAFNSYPRKKLLKRTKFTWTRLLLFKPNSKLDPFFSLAGAVWDYEKLRKWASGIKQFALEVLDGIPRL